MKSIKQLILIVAVLMSMGSIAQNSKQQTFMPGAIWPDNNGVHINAHGGGLLEFDGTYYWYGEHKIEGKAGNRAMVGVHVYSSNDLYNWKDEGIALKVSEDPESPIVEGCIIERPKVIYNKETKKFVMWFHHELKGMGYDAAKTGLAVADSPTGPFQYIHSVNPNAGQWPLNFTAEQKQMTFPKELKSWSEEWLEAVADGLFVHRDFEKGQMARDMTLFVDDDGKAYHIHASEENLTLHISELNDEYTAFTDRYVAVMPAGHNEAPAIFKKDGKYYLITSGCTGWAPNAARSFVADHIFGPWTSLGNPSRGTEEQMETTFDSQSTYILENPEKPGEFIFMGDRWVPENAIDGRYIWLPIEFEGDKPVIKWPVDAEETRMAPYDDPELTSINLEPYRATFTPYENAEAASVAAGATSRALSLNGLWKFQMVLGKEHVNPDFVQPAFDDHDWADLPVPSNWQRHGFGLPVYSNSTLNTEPDEVGLYRRIFTIPKEWSGDRIILHFAGVKTAYHVYINGKEIGYNEGAFLPGEFDITENIKKGENTLAVAVYRTAAVSDIENFDTWRLSGIFRDVTLLNRPQTYIEDFEVQSPLINDYQDGQWLVRINVRNKSKGKASGLKLVASILDDKTGERIHFETLNVSRIEQGDMTQVEVVKILPDIRPWSDEKPNLYTTVLELRDNQGVLEAVSAKTGFRTIEVQGRRLLINGERLIFRGVNRHSWDPDWARVPRPDYLRKELELMKRYNINSVRTSHYPSDPYLYKLADELGIFIMDEAAQETHWKNDRASRDGWLQPHLVRMQGMIERDKNHPSVVMWSTGNEYFSGVNTDSMALYTAERDPSRPIFFEGSKNKDPDKEPDVRYEREILNTAYEISRPESLLNFAKADRPVIAKEYMHARGNTLNRFYELWELMRDPQHENLSGGFIWDWKDQGWRVHAGDARSFLDNGETIGKVWHAHDGSDGITDSDLNITAKLLEVSKAQQQLEVQAVSGKKNAFVVTNYYKFTSLSDFVTTYVIEHNGEPILRGSLVGLEAAPGETTEFSIDVNQPDLGNGEYWVTFEFFLKESVSGIPVTHALAWSQLPLKKYEPSTVMVEPSRPMRILEDGNHFIMKLDRVRYEISKKSGKITSWQIDGQELLQDGNGFEPTLWRAPIAPDVPEWGGNDKRYVLPWKEVGLDQTELVASSVNLSEDGIHLDVELSMQTGSEAIAVFRQRYTLLEDGSLAVGTLFLPGATIESLTSLPRLGIACELNSNFNQVSWFGKGPQENYINRREGARIGNYSLTTEELYTDYLEPQSSGNRSLIRWMEITDISGSGFRASLIPVNELMNQMQFLPADESIDQAVAGQWFEFTAIPYSEDELAPASLFSQLPPSSGVSVHLDLEQSGVSQKPWPPRWPEDEVQPVKKAFVFILKPLP